MRAWVNTPEGWVQHGQDRSSPKPFYTNRTRKRESYPSGSAAGGWKDVTTLLTCYQHADEATMLKVMTWLSKLVSRRAAGAVEKR